MPNRFLSLPHSQLEFDKIFNFFCYKAALYPSCRNPPIDSVPNPVECSSPPVEPDRWEGFEKLVENAWFTVLKVVDEYCS